jgi:hypothetical protein
MVVVVVVVDMMQLLHQSPHHHLNVRSQAGRTKSKQHPLQHGAMSQVSLALA